MNNFNIKKFYEINTTNGIKKLEVTQIEYTTYEDGSCWIHYKIDDEKFGYALADVDKLNEPFNDIKKLIQKPNVEICSEQLKRLVYECLQSENEMWYVDEEDMEYYGYNLDALEDEIDKLNISQYIEINEDDCDIITVYGGIITKFLF